MNGLSMEDANNIRGGRTDLVDADTYAAYLDRKTADDRKASEWQETLDNPSFQAYAEQQTDKQFAEINILKLRKLRKTWTDIRVHDIVEAEAMAYDDESARKVDADADGEDRMVLIEGDEDDPFDGHAPAAIVQLDRVHDAAAADTDAIIPGTKVTLPDGDRATVVEMDEVNRNFFDVPVGSSVVLRAGAEEGEEEHFSTDDLITDEHSPQIEPGQVWISKKYGTEHTVHGEITGYFDRWIMIGPIGNEYTTSGSAIIAGYTLDLDY